MRPTGPDRRASRRSIPDRRRTTRRSIPDRPRATRRAVPTAAGGRRRTTLPAAEDGQAAVELVALLPVIAVLVAGAWQAALAGHAVWAANAAARAAARAHAVGADPRAAARSHLPRSLERGLRVTAEQGGDVRVTVRIPALPGLPSPGRADAAAHFEPQT